MRKGDLKLVHYWDTKEDFLYDLSKDLGEKTNLAKSRADVTAKMLAELKAHVKAGVGEQKFAQLESGKLPTGDAKGKGKKKKK
jgi:hypothetical protein